MSRYPLECVCTGPGVCEARGRECSATMHARCQTDARYRYLLSGIPRTEWPAELQPVPKPAKREPKPRPAPRPRLRLPCINLGKRQLPPADPNGVACGCPGKEVWTCDVHGRCTKGQAFPGVACCNGCPDYETDAAPFTRHLCYHVYPIRGNGAWQSNVDMLCQRIGMFDGKIVVAVATDPADGRKPDPTGPNAPDTGRRFDVCDSLETVRERFGEHAKRIDFLHFENDPTLREVATVMPMLERIPGGPRDVVLYAQAKGVTRHLSHIAHHWTRVLYEVYLDYWHVVERQLNDRPITGAFKKLGPGWKPEQHKSDWHYSGSWFWVRTADLFARDWRKIDQMWSGIEPYPSQQFEASEADTLFHEAAVPKMNLYSGGYWKRIVNPALEKWKAEHAR